MHDAKQKTVESKKTTEELKAERQSDATDDEVLREEQSGSSSASETGSKGRTPSPDGAFDEKEEVDKAGPM